MSKAKRPRRKFTDEFKEQIVQLYLNGKSKSEIIKEYDITPSSLNRWIDQHQNTGSFRSKDNLSDSEKELIELRKRLKQLEMENDILKQAAEAMEHAVFAKNFRQKESKFLVVESSELWLRTAWYQAIQWQNINLSNQLQTKM